MGLVVVYHSLHNILKYYSGSLDIEPNLKQCLLEGKINMFVNLHSLSVCKTNLASRMLEIPDPLRGVVGISN